MQKSQFHFYLLTEEIRKAVPFTVPSNRVKHLLNHVVERLVQ